MTESTQQRQQTIRQWLLLRANRWLLTGAILFGAFTILVATSQLAVTPLRTVATSQDTVDTLFAAFIGAIITGTSIVVTINQLVLSQELGAVGDQRERMRESIAYLHDVETTVLQAEDTQQQAGKRESETTVSPPEPAAFLVALLKGIERQAEQLHDAAVNESSSTGDQQSETTLTVRDKQLQRDIVAYTEDLREESTRARHILEGAQFGSFDVLWGMLQFNYSWYLSRGRQLQSEYENQLRDEPTETVEQPTEANAFEELIEGLTLVGPTREHFKTLYFQWELIDLSRALLIIAVPTLLVMGAMILYVDESTLPGTILGIDNLVWITSAAFTVGISPFVVFIVSLLRIATVAKQTLAMGPFILLESRRNSEE